MKKLTDFGTRTASGLIIAAVLLSVIFFGGVWGLASIVAIISVLAVGELYRIARPEAVFGAEIPGFFAVAVLPFAAASWGANGIVAVLAVFVVCALASHVLVVNSRIQVTALVVFGAVYVGVMLSHLVLIRQLTGGILLVFVMTLSVWANDVLAYTVGSLAGRHALAPRISPKKSWEGLAAGTMGTLVLWMVLPPVFSLPLTPVARLGIGLAVSVAAVLGDLVESRIKRECHVKDSGTLLPGHGGYLDRFDGFLLVSVVTYYALHLAGVS